ncbi:hypothetical protein [Psychrobacter sp. VH5]|uniref:hypothetical protein n=1 Tax=Psychrobacter sp. VH5 TaxID=3423439 RepID=UPI003D661E43
MPTPLRKPQKINTFGYQGVHNIVRQRLMPDIHALEGRGFTALDNKMMFYLAVLFL